MSSIESVCKTKQSYVQVQKLNAGRKILCRKTSHIIHHLKDLIEWS